MTTDSVGGVWSYSIELCKALVALDNCDIVLACMGGKLGAAERKEAGSLPNVELHESCYRLEWMEEPWDDVERAGDWLQGLLQRTGADLLHLNCFGPAVRRWEVPVLLVAHSCVHSWWRATRKCEPDASWNRYRDCVIRALYTADRIIAPTAASLNAVRGCYEEVNLTGRAQVIYNGIDTGDWAAARTPSARFVFGVGRVWDEAKNLRQLAAVAPYLHCPLMIAGDGKLDRDPGRVVMLGSLSRSQLLPYYRRASVFAHPARYEPFGLAVLEAALCGCPLVLGNIDSLKELWDGAAVFADPDDTQAWREALQRLLASPDERRRRGATARARALRYSATNMAASYAAEYRRLLEMRSENVA
ncbi:MAG: glycosyltransferase [Woeseia sp.]